MRDLSRRIGRECPQGFTGHQILGAYRQDERLDEYQRGIHETYLYHVMKRLALEGLIIKVGRGKYMLSEMVEGAHEAPNGIVVATEAGYKIVPMTKEERVREEIRRYLSRRANKTAHRANIADYLASHSGPLSNDKNPLKALSTYVIRWPEFVTDGEGNYTYVEGEKSESAGMAPPIQS